MGFGYQKGAVLFSVGGIGIWPEYPGVRALRAVFGFFKKNLSINSEPKPSIIDGMEEFSSCHGFVVTTQVILTITDIPAALAGFETANHVDPSHVTANCLTTAGHPA
ncbi:hypothetical protein B0H67DRAFT_301646 [Lasiosphaeris hirsuta]|uniref:Uncharacterized protein n=1 Tax=Lasiosphaeris hirsuta TaxID=260670 RepID=A0AA40A9N5_9PEZI|nr:hypothetical protein B0H67DRAFT_301646 [Lasiosphaeris hirsuta]